MGGSMRTLLHLWALPLLGLGERVEILILTLFKAKTVDITCSSFCDNLALCINISEFQLILGT